MRPTSHLRTSLLALGAFFLLALPMLSAPAAAGGDWLSLENPNPKAAPSEYWTPERLASARPLPLPRPTAVNYADEDATEPLAAGEPFGEDGAPPRVRRAPELAEQLFEYDPEVAAAIAAIEEYDQVLAAEDWGVEPDNAGTVGAQFTSSRVFPDTKTTTYPTTTVGKLFFTQPGVGNFICSGAVIRHRLIITAGHCVHRGSGGQGGFFTNFNFVPALRGATAPYGQWGWSYVIVTNTWATGNGNVPNAADYALIEPQDRTVSGVVRKISYFTGYLGYQTLKQHPNHITALGYPANHDSATRMHEVNAGTFRNIAGKNTYEIGSDMRGGSSGGPWVQNFGVVAAGQSGGTNPGTNRVVAVTSYGPTAVGPFYQGASKLDTRFSPGASSILTIACAHRAGNCS